MVFIIYNLKLLIIMATKKKVVKKKKDIKISAGILYVQTTNNNTIVTLTTAEGAKVLWWGAGTQNFKWSKKSTPYAAEVLTKSILQEGKNYGLERVGIVFRGTGMAREGVFKAINETGMVDIEYIHEDTGIQFGGCKGIRPKRN